MLFSAPVFAESVFESEEGSAEAQTECMINCRNERMECVKASTCNETAKQCRTDCPKDDKACRKNCANTRTNCVLDSGCAEKGKECFRLCKDA